MATGEAAKVDTKSVLHLCSAKGGLAQHDGPRHTSAARNNGAEVFSSPLANGVKKWASNRTRSQPTAHEVSSRSGQGRGASIMSGGGGGVNQNAPSSISAPTQQVLNLSLDCSQFTEGWSRAERASGLRLRLHDRWNSVQETEQRVGLECWI